MAGFALVAELAHNHRFVAVLLSSLKAFIKFARLCNCLAQVIDKFYFSGQVEVSDPDQSRVLPKDHILLVVAESIESFSILVYELVETKLYLFVLQKDLY